MLGIYVHLPFCPYICPYCDFAKWPHKASSAQRYLRALQAEIEATPAEAAATLFYGGGTPNEYSAGQIAALTAQLHARFAGLREITIELNPELVRPGDFETYLASGISRVSLGVQSFEPSEIATLGRKHTPAQVAGAVAAARSAGIRSVSIDLIFAVPGQTAISWRRSLEAAIALGVDHVSTYGLTIEEDTPYARWQARDPGAFVDEASEAELYAIAMDTLTNAGLEQYEISNFAKAGHDCLHNANYWSNGEYIGLGVGAASYRSRVRSVHTRSLDAYVEAALAGKAVPGESERLDDTKRAGEATMLALRTAKGVNVVDFKNRYGVDFMQFYAPVIAEHAAAGLLKVDETSVRLTRRGRFVANDVCGAFVTFA